jgi:hypothetical protein
MAFAPDGTLYIVGNQINGLDNFATIRRGGAGAATSAAGPPSRRPYRTRAATPPSITNGTASW